MVFRPLLGMFKSCRTFKLVKEFEDLRVFWYSVNDNLLGLDENLFAKNLKDWSLWWSIVYGGWLEERIACICVFLLPEKKCWCVNQVWSICNQTKLLIVLLLSRCVDKSMFSSCAIIKPYIFKINTFYSEIKVYLITTFINY